MRTRKRLNFTMRPKITPVLAISLAAYTAFLPACSSNCGSCEGAGLLIGMGIGVIAAPVAVPAMAIERGLARGPMPIISEAAPGTISLAFSFNSDLANPRASWVRPGEFVLSGRAKSGPLISQVVKQSAPLDIAGAEEQSGSPLGVIDDRILFGDTTDSLHLFDLKTHISRPVPNLDCSVNLMPGNNSLSLDGHRLICQKPTLSKERTFILIDTTTWQQIRRLTLRGPLDKDPQMAMGFDASNDLLVASTKGALTRYSGMGEEVEIPVGLQGDHVWSVHGIPSSTSVVAAINPEPVGPVIKDGAGEAIVFDVLTGARRLVVPIAQNQQMGFLQFSASSDGRRLVILEQSQAEVYDLQSDKRIALVTTGEGHQMLSAALDSTGDWLIVTAEPKVAVFRLSEPPIHQREE